MRHGVRTVRTVEVPYFLLLYLLSDVVRRVVWARTDNKDSHRADFPFSTCVANGGHPKTRNIDDFQTRHFDHFRTFYIGIP